LPDIIDPIATEIVQLSNELNAATHHGMVVVSIRKDPKSFLGVHLNPNRARDFAQYILALADELDPNPLGK
jgi:hypothetical protein